MNNYQFRIVSNENPITIQNLNNLAVNYCVEPNARMANRIKIFNDNHRPKGNKLYSSAMNYFNNSEKNSYFQMNLNYNPLDNSLFTSTDYFYRANDISLNITTAIDLATGNSIVPPTDYTFNFDSNNGILTITPSSDYSHYNLLFEATGEIQNDHFINYALTYTGTKP